MVGSTYFQSYQRNLHRILMVEMLDDHKQAQTARRLSIVGPSLTHEQWIAAQAERRRLAKQHA
jgi:hypothetical protein